MRNQTNNNDWDVIADIKKIYKKALGPYSFKATVDKMTFTERRWFYRIVEEWKYHYIKFKSCIEQLQSEDKEENRQTLQEMLSAARGQMEIRIALLKKRLRSAAMKDSLGARDIIYKCSTRKSTRKAKITIEPKTLANQRNLCSFSKQKQYFKCPFHEGNGNRIGSGGSGNYFNQ